VQQQLMFVVLSSVVIAQGPPAAPGQQQGPLAMLLPQIVVLPRDKHELVVDGSLTDWPELPAVRLDDRRQLSGTKNKAWIGPSDASANAFFLWDAEALWIACAVRDEWHRALDAKTLSLTEIPVADSVMLTFDPGRDTRSSGADPGRREDREFWLADEAGRAVVQWDRLRGTARLLDTAVARTVVLHDKEQGITSYEARIPWSEILPPGQDPKASTVIDAQIVVNDFDETTDSMPQTRIGLTFGCHQVIDPGLFGSMMLVADAKALQGVVPEFPPKPAAAVAEPLPGAAYWQQWLEKLLLLPPEVFTGTGAPQESGGIKRTTLLEELDGHCARMPRVDLLEFHQRIHRSMFREADGIAARGLPLLWAQRLASVSKNAEDAVPAGKLRLFQLPMGGWLCRFANASFLVDAAGAHLENLLWGGAGFCVLTEPLAITRRNDQLLLRMFMAEPPRHVFMHIAFHLPVVPMATMPLVELGKSYGSPTGARIHALGKAQADGSVPWSCSYRIEIPGGPQLLLVSATAKAAEFDVQGVDVAIVSPRNPELLEIVKKVAPAVVFLDESFLVHAHPTLARVTLRDLHAIQQAIVPVPSVLLAPGESWTIESKNK
jgi:hypothetical protein